ncbi:hypothetical protein EIL50_03950 [bacterium NHP-B]|nr:hypothetical protein EIL50_03950 [bacterium NHP-B]
MGRHGMTNSLRSLSREEERHAFLNKHGAGQLPQEPLLQDCSDRVYIRLQGHGMWNNEQVMFVDDPDPDNAKRFADIAHYLASLGLRVPHIYAASEHGFLLIEDLGETRFRDVLKDDPSAHDDLWETLFDTLIHLQKASHQTGASPASAAPPTLAHHHASAPPSLERMTVETLLEEVDIFLEWGLSYIGRSLSAPERHEARRVWEMFLTPLADHMPCQATEGYVCVHKDFHSENLLILDAEGLQGCGVIDFQDALWGPPAYDLVSLIEDVRLPFDGPRITQQKAHFIHKQSLFTNHEWEATYDRLSLQRAVKIFGVFCRLALRDGKLKKVDYLANTFLFIEQGLKHPAAHDVRDWFLSLDFKRRLESF